MPRRRSSLGWGVLAVGLVIVVALALRYGTHILDHAAVFDEQYITQPIDDLLNLGWSVDTAIDFTETKGPALIWTYALLGEVFGGDLNDLRLISLLFFIGGVIPLVLIARRCGLSGPSVCLVAALYVLLPHNAILAQMMMSEASFIFGALWLMYLFLWGIGAGAERSPHRLLGPILFGLLLAILLHNRIHAVAFAGAACLVALERDRFNSWPWWAACLIAGLLRIPLWARWGGLVAPAYQGMHGLGVDLSNMTYLAAAFVPYTAIFLAPLVLDTKVRRVAWKYAAAGAAIGLLLGIAFPPDLRETIVFNEEEAPRFLGFVATAARRLAGDAMAQHMIVATLSMIGLASIGALFGQARAQPVREAGGQVGRLLVWTLLCGWMLYGLTNGYVFDRYLLPWAVLMPVAWILLLPRPLVILQALELVAIFSWLTKTWLF